MTSAIFVELLGGIGDLIFALPALDALTRSHPGMRWDVLTFAPGGELLIGDPRVHEVFFARRTVTPPGANDDRHAQGHPPCWHDLANLLATHRYDLAVNDTRHSGIHALIEASGVPRVATQLWSRAGLEEPIAELFLRRLREDGLIEATTTSSRPRIWLAEGERRAAAATWAARGVAPDRAVVLNPHAGMAIKRWPADRFIAVGTALAQVGWELIVLDGEEPDDAAAIARGIPGARVLPRLTLRETAACLARVALVVSGDSGIAHLASAVGRPVVAIYGPTWSGRYGVARPSRNLQSPFDCPDLNPLNFTLQRCWYTGQCIFPGKQTCCADVRPETVIVAARALLREQETAESGRERRRDVEWARC
jgi:ADP-heptose:LPS heptosyltransferase